MTRPTRLGCALIAALLWLLPAAPARADDLGDAGVAIAARDYDEGLPVVLEVLDDPDRAADHARAWALLGQVWLDHDLPYAALLAFSEAAEGDPAALGDRLGTALELAVRIGDEGVLEDHLVEPVAGEHRLGAAVFGARALIRSGAYEPALDLLGIPSPDAEWFVRAQDLRGIALTNLDRPEEALAALLTAEAAARQGGDTALIARTTLNAGRAYYAAGNYLKAIEHFGTVPRASTRWREARFERAWGHFAIDDHVGTYSVLLALRTPWFADWYQAEADLLRVQSLFLLCKFSTARDEIAAFTARYTPVAERLDATVGALSPREAWADATGWLEGRSPELPPAVLYRFRYEERFTDARAAVARAEREVALAGRLDTGWADRAVPLLQARADAVREVEGARVLARARGAQAELADLLDGIQFVELDILQFETDLFSEAAVTGELEFGDRLGRLRDLRKQRGIRAWPFQGEHWADEVGYLRAEVRSDCPEDQPR